MFSEMRRKRQALPLSVCEEILYTATNGVLALAGENGYPYAVPLSYVYDGKKLYFHCARSGHKLRAAAQCSKSSFCVIDRDMVVPEKFTTYFRSVIVFGTLRILMPDEMFPLRKMKKGPTSAEVTYLPNETAFLSTEKTTSPAVTAETTEEVPEMGVSTRYRNQREKAADQIMRIPSAGATAASSIKDVNNLMAGNMKDVNDPAAGSTKIVNDSSDIDTSITSNSVTDNAADQAKAAGKASFDTIGTSQAVYTALEKLAKKYAPHQNEALYQDEIERFWHTVCILELTPTHITGKQAIELVKDGKKDRCSL